MNREEARQAVKEKWLVGIRRIGRPDQPYVGRLTGELSDGSFGFEGNSGSERISGKAKPEEFFHIRKEEE